jgi:hypothetical protein
MRGISNLDDIEYSETPNLFTKNLIKIRFPQERENTHHKMILTQMYGIFALIC